MSDVVRESFELPTVIFTVLVGIAAILWIVSLAGFGDAEDAADGVLDDLLSPLGLAGVPTNLLVSLFALFGWATSAVLSVTILDAVSGIAALFVGIAIGIAGVVVAALVIRALAPRLSRTFTPTLTHSADALVGHTVEVRSANVTLSRGYGDVRAPDGTTDRVDLRVRSDRADRLTFATGDEALIIFYDRDERVYIIDELPL